MHLPMPPRWSMTPDDPCARSSEYDQSWRYGRLGRYCADRRALMPPGSVEMPAGFAPVLGMDAIFVPAPPGSSDYPNAGPMPGPMAGPMPGPTPGPMAGPFAASQGAPKIARAEPPRAPPPVPQDRVVKEVPSKPLPAAKVETPPRSSTRPICYPRRPRRLRLPIRRRPRLPLSARPPRHRQCRPRRRLQGAIVQSFPRSLTVRAPSQTRHHCRLRTRPRLRSLRRQLQSRLMLLRWRCPSRRRRTSHTTRRRSAAPSLTAPGPSP